ncbi:hypothetical protein QCA50_010739 [Cerrena zonata]|uniref:Zn(2)-C6 fungal-type domain-containing protein n=1 Tax=Cerrena zonata TaxID=2478898 RepID=A0AAW0GA61_9APHY
MARSGRSGSPRTPTSPVWASGQFEQVPLRQGRRKRTQTACTSCHHNKRKCDGTGPCSTCYFAQRECVYKDRKGKVIPAPVQAHKDLQVIVTTVDLERPSDAILTYRTGADAGTYITDCKSPRLEL